MSRIKLLLDVVNDMRSLADSLQAVAEAVSQDGAAEPADAPAEKPVAKKTAKTVQAKKTEDAMPEESQTKETEASEEEKPLTLEMVRAALAEKSRAGHTDEVRALLEKHGAPKLSGIDPAEYPALLAEVEVL